VERTANSADLCHQSATVRAPLGVKPVQMTAHATLDAYPRASPAVSRPNRPSLSGL
jgi:hypothetical protein